MNGWGEQLAAFWLGSELGEQGTLVWTSPPWMVGLAAVLCLVALLAAIPKDRPLPSRLAELSLWSMALLGAMVALAGPAWVEEAGRVEPGRVALLVDGSTSMSILEEGAPRSDAVQAIVDHVQASADQVEVFHFDGELRTGLPDAYDGDDTQLAAALDRLSDRLAGEKLAGVVVISDGLDRGALRRGFLQGDAVAPDALQGPLTVYQVGAATHLEDLAVRSVDAGGYAFIRSPFRIIARVHAEGVTGDVPVTLSRDGATVTQRTVTLDEHGDAEVEFEVTAEDAGRFAYTVGVPVYEGDAVPANNVMPVVVSVVRDRIRVLQVAGAPSWDVKFLRRFLKGDPSVQLVSFFILRTPSDVTGAYRDEELSLIQFPYERLFDEDLSTFDVVVFQNFDYRPYFQYSGSRLLDNIKTYVEEGGALVMVGGDRSFSLGQYGNTPLGDVLPVELSPTPMAPDLQSFQPRLTEAGARHPITRLSGDPVENREWWERLVPLDGTNRPTGLAPGAQALLEHPTLRTAAGAPVPILAVREVKRGRTMAFTVDSSWRYSLAEAAEGRGNQAYLRLWKNAVRWLMKDTTTSRVTVDTPRENYAVGDEIRIVTRARDAGFAPQPDARVSVTLDHDGEITTLQGETNLDGEVVLPFDAARPGTHRVQAEVMVGDAVVGTASTVFAVTDRDPELDEVAPDGRFLTWWTERLGGRFHGPGELGPVLLDPDAGHVVDDRRETALWHAPLLALWTLLFAGVAWWVRRKSGLR